MWYRLAKVLAAGLLLGWAGTGFPADIMIEMELQNNTKPRKAATDLHVKFTMKVAKATATDETADPHATNGTVDATGETADFEIGKANSVPPGASVVVKFEAPAGTTIDKDKSYWTTPA